MCSGGSHTPSRVRGFPIRTSTDRNLVGSSPRLFAATHVLHRHQAPRHPPLALCSLENKDGRARYGVLKEGVKGLGAVPASRRGLVTPSKRNRGARRPLQSSLT